MNYKINVLTVHSYIMYEWLLVCHRIISFKVTNHEIIKLYNH